MKFFPSRNQALTYASQELLETLKHDLNKMREKEPENEINEMERRIEDLESIQSLIENAEDLLQAAKVVVENWENNKLAECVKSLALIVRSSES